MPDTLSIETHDLGRIYKLRNRKKNEEKQLVALQGVNLEVKQGELFGLLGGHIGAALKHHFIERDDTLARMIPWLKKS